jgi:hypothetical protein
MPKNETRRVAGFIRNNPIIIAHDIFLATPNSNFAHSRGFEPQIRVSLAKNGNSSLEIATARMLESGRFSKAEAAVPIEFLRGAAGSANFSAEPLARVG